MIFCNSDNMMALKTGTATATNMVTVPALLASVVVAFQYGLGEGPQLGSVVNAALATLPVTMIFSALHAIGILVLGQALVPSHLSFFGLKPSLTVFGVVTLHLNNMTPIVVSLMARLKTHACQCGASLLSQAFVPRRNLPERSGFTVRVMTPLINRCDPLTLLSNGRRAKDFTATALANLFNLCLGTTHASHLRKDIELFAVHYTGKFEGIQGKECELLEHPESHNRHNVAGNGKRDGMKSVMDWAISSQAAWKQVEGPTTRVWSLNRQRHGGKTPRAHSPNGMM